MNVTIGEVQTQVEASATGQPASSNEDSKTMGITEKSRESRLAENRANRIRERLRAD